MFNLPPFCCLKQTTLEIERILLSIDYYFEHIEEGSGFIELTRNSGVISEAEVQMIGFKNAEKLFGFSA